jgi:hypothetical protein
MTPTDDLRLTLRMNLDEVIPPGGTDADTMFTDAEIDNLLSQSQTIEEASWRGWVLKGMRVAMSAVGGLETAQMGSENFRWASASDFLDLAKQMAGYWWDQIPTGMTPDVGGTGIILSIAPVPMPGINVPVGDMGDQWSTSGTVWWPGDLSRLQTYIKHGWQWPSAETYQATIPQ